MSAPRPRRARSPLRGRGLEEVQQKFRAASYTSHGQDWAKLFRHYDRDNSGELDWEEFRRAVRKDAQVTSEAVSDAELQGLFRAADADRGGTIGEAEFVALLDGVRPAPPRPAPVRAHAVRAG